MNYLHEQVKDRADDLNERYQTRKEDIKEKYEERKDKIKERTLKIFKYYKSFFQ